MKYLTEIDDELMKIRFEIMSSNSYTISNYNLSQKRILIKNSIKLYSNISHRKV